METRNTRRSRQSHCRQLHHRVSLSLRQSPLFCLSKLREVKEQQPQEQQEQQGTNLSKNEYLSSEDPRMEASLSMRRNDYIGGGISRRMRIQERGCVIVSGPDLLLIFFLFTETFENTYRDITPPTFEIPVKRRKWNSKKKRM